MENLNEKNIIPKSYILKHRYNNKRYKVIAEIETPIYIRGGIGNSVLAVGSKTNEYILQNTNNIYDNMICDSDYVSDNYDRET